MSDEKMQAAPVEKPEKPKKKGPVFVGRFTLGFTLIGLGILFTAGFFVPMAELLTVVKCMPLILVLLGAEILIAAIGHGDRNVKVGFGMTFLCLVLIFGAGVSAVLPQLWEQYGEPRWEEQNKIVQQTKNEFYQQVDSTTVQGVSVHLDEENKPTHIGLDLRDQVESEKEFAEAAVPMVRALAEMGIQTASIRGENEETAWELHLDGVAFQKDITAKRITEIVHTIDKDY